jgi:CHASE3 domain sensor protein
MKPAKRLMTVLFSIAALLLIGSVVFDYKVGLNATRANRRMAAELGVAYRLKNFLSVLKDTETGQRGYLLTGEESYLAPYREGLSQIQKELEELRQLAARGDLPKNEVEHLTQLTAQKLDELNQTVRLRADQGLEPALKIVRSNRGKEIMDQIRDQTARLEASAHTRIETANRFAYRAARVRTATFVTTGLACLLFLGWMFRKISAEMGNREAAVREASQQKELFSKTLSSIGDGVIATDSEGRVTFMNPVAEKLTGWNQQEAFGVPLERPFKILNEATRQVVENPVTKVRQTGVVVGLANHTILAMAAGAQEQLQVKNLQAVADKGYHEADQLQACEQAGIETFVPDQGKTSGLSKDGQAVFPKEQFRYEARTDVYFCPGGATLTRGKESQNRGKARFLYSNRAACRVCPLKSQCTTSAYRAIARRTNEEVVERQAARVVAHPELVARRKQIVEHVFGTLRNWGHDTFLMRGLEKVQAEFSLSALAYNLRRVLNLISIEKLVADA